MGVGVGWGGGGVPPTPLDPGVALLANFSHAERHDLLKHFHAAFRGPRAEHSAAAPPDALSTRGALDIYLRARNAAAAREAAALSATFAARRGGGGGGEPEGVPPGSTPGGTHGGTPPPSAPGAEGRGGAAAAPVRFEQSASLSSESDMTALVLFHPFETALVSADDGSRVSVWDYEDGGRLLSFRNGNPYRSRMTSLKFVNPGHKSLLLVASDEGVVRLWDGVLTAQRPRRPQEADDRDAPDVPEAPPRGGGGDARWGAPPRGVPPSGVPQGGVPPGPRPPAPEEEEGGATLVTSFLAVPDIVGGHNSSGLVTDWRQDSGALVTGGSSATLRVWDLSQEQNVVTWRSGSESACVTTLASTALAGGGPAAASYAVVAGYGDGAIRIFDARGAADLNPVVSMVEHQHWVVHIQMGSDGYGIISGSLYGEAKFWDLRYTGRGSIRSVDVQRSPMTALAVHPHAPVMASGSHKQFIKILDLEGDQLGMIKHHNNFLGQRIGPVSCLAFHPSKLLLAAGATDSIISVYHAD